jgi:hypothetical protein
LGTFLGRNLVLIKLIQEGLPHALPGIIVVVVRKSPAFLWEGVGIRCMGTTICGKVNSQGNMSASVGVEFPRWQGSNGREGSKGGVGEQVVHLCPTSRKWGFAIMPHLSGRDIGRGITTTSMGGHKLKFLEQGL